MYALPAREEGVRVSGMLTGLYANPCVPQKCRGCYFTFLFEGRMLSREDKAGNLLRMAVIQKQKKKKKKRKGKTHTQHKRTIEKPRTIAHHWSAWALILCIGFLFKQPWGNPAGLFSGGDRPTESIKLRNLFFLPCFPFASFPV